MSAKTTELKPCPFCGSGNVRYKEAEHAVVCARCKARGSIAPDEEMAIRMWDERAGELKPDSWEKLEEDMDRCIEKSDSCMYFSPGGDCFKCAKPDSETCGCTAAVFNDIKRRIRRLRGEN